MKTKVSFLLVWILCFIIAMATAVKVRPSKSITLGVAVAFFVGAPFAAVVGTVLYVGESELLSKCVLGCKK